MAKTEAEKQKERARGESYRQRNVIMAIPKDQAHKFGAFPENSDLTNREMANKIREHNKIVLVRKKAVSELRQKVIDKLTSLKVKDSEGKSDYETWSMYKLKSAFTESQVL